MASRLNLQEELETLIGKKVYYQPPETVKMMYPCIVYDLSKMKLVRADNKIYVNFKAYEIMYITKNPDDPMIETILNKFENINFDRQYKANNLYHNVYTLFY